ncbi:MAG: aspartate-semialdehyde dehydrogenase [Bacteroidales bacterium]
MKIAVVGATGLVGRKMMQVLQERNLTFDALIPVASARSAGKTVDFGGRSISVITPAEALEKSPQIVLFSAGGDTSRQWAGRFAEQGCFVIDNSSAWRMDENVPLVVPEINAASISKHTRIIANPNCSTIQMVLALAPLHRRYGIRRIVVSTYQSVTGSGLKGVRQLESERNGIAGEKAYPHAIDLNLLPHGGAFNADGYTTEEQKLIDESRKILGDHDLLISPTVVRVPVYGGHSESINVELKKAFAVDEVKEVLAGMPGIVVQDDPDENLYPMPLTAQDRDEVFVGRIRRDHSCENGLNMWVVSDNLRKGAATNAVQIAEYLLEQGLV